MIERHFCPNCGIQVAPEPDGLGDMPLEEMVERDHEIRLQQYGMSLRGEPYRHSIAIASGSGEAR